MRVKFPDFNPVDCTERKIEKYEKVHEANREYLDYLSAFSGEINVKFIEREKVEDLESELVLLKNKVWDLEFKNNWLVKEMGKIEAKLKMMRIYRLGFEKEFIKQ